MTGTTSHSFSTIIDNFSLPETSLFDFLEIYQTNTTRTAKCALLDDFVNERATTLWFGGFFAFGLILMTIMIMNTLRTTPEASMKTRYTRWLMRFLFCIELFFVNRCIAFGFFVSWIEKIKWHGWNFYHSGSMLFYVAMCFLYVLRVIQHSNTNDIHDGYNEWKSSRHFIIFIIIASPSIQFLMIGVKFIVIAYLQQSSRALADRIMDLIQAGFHFSLAFILICSFIHLWRVTAHTKNNTFWTDAPTFSLILFVLFSKCFLNLVRLIVNVGFVAGEEYPEWYFCYSLASITFNGVVECIFPILLLLWVILYGNLNVGETGIEVAYDQY